MFPAGFWSRERVRRFALQLEGERWASAWPPLTARSRRPRTKPLANDDPPVASDIGIFLRCLAICDRRLRVQRRSVIYAGAQQPSRESCWVSTANRTRGVARLCAVPGTLLRPTPAGLHIALCVLTHPVRCPWDACAQQAFAVGHGAGPRRGHGCRQAGAADSIGSASAMTRRAASSSRSGGRRARRPAAAGPPRSTSRVPSPLVTASGHRLPARDVPRWILVEGEDQ